MLIQRAELLDGRVVDIRLADTIEEVAADLAPRPGEDTLDAANNAVLPGLHDHHLHLRAAAAAETSVRVGPLQARTAEDLARILSQARPGEDGWIRAVGYHDSVAGPLDRHLLDELGPALPLRVQHRSGALWTLNSPALHRTGFADHPDGRFRRGEQGPRLAESPPSLRQLSDRLSGYGVTGVTDATPGQTRGDIENLGAAACSGDIAQRLHCMAPAGLAAIRGVTLGPAKKILDDDSLDLDALQAWIGDNHRHDHAVAVHCVTDSQLVVTIAALRAAGVHPGDRIEHAAVVPADCIADLAELGSTVVTQPNFIAERGDQYLAEVPADEHDQLWRVAGLYAGGVRVALSTDAPFGAADPWASMRAAVRRETPSGVILGPRERVSAATALAMFLGHPRDPASPRRVAHTAQGDLCILSVPLRDALAELDAGLVAATVIGGELVYNSSVG